MIKNYDVTELFPSAFLNYSYKVYFLNIQENKFAERIKSYFAGINILNVFCATLFIAQLTLNLFSQNVPTIYLQLFTL